MCNTDYASITFTLHALNMDLFTFWLFTCFWYGENWKERSSKVCGQLIYPQRIYHFRLSCTHLGNWGLRHLQWTRFVFVKICATRLVENVECDVARSPSIFSGKCYFSKWYCQYNIWYKYGHTITNNIIIWIWTIDPFSVSKHCDFFCGRS